VTDPKRWSEEGEESDVMRELMLAGQSRRMPDSERRAVWAGIALALPATPPPVTDLAASASGATTAGSLGGYLAKGLLVLATLGGAGFGALQLWPRAEPPAPAPVVAHAPAKPAATAPDVTAPEPVATALPVVSAAAPPSSATKARSNPESQLREESLAVLEARSRFPRGALGQEREALTIEALARSGQSAAARRRAEAFLRQHPNSPYLADVRRVTER
jgi:hypothetical protein